MRTASALALVLAWSATATAESPSRLKLRDAPAQLLGGVIAVKLPDGMNVESVDRTLSAGVKPSWRDEAKATLDLEDGQLTMLAFETYSAMGKTFRSDVAVDLQSQGVRASRIRKLALRAPLAGFEVVPKIPKSSLDASTFIYGAYIGARDGTVQVLAFYVSRGALPHARPWTSLARRITRSVTPGKSPIELDAGEKRLSRVFRIVTPAGWTSTTQLGANIDPVAIFQLRHVAPSLLTRAPSCALQLSGTGKVPPETSMATATFASKVLGQDVTWTAWKDASGATMTTTLERVVWHSLPLHISCTAPEREQLDEMRDMIGTLRQIDE